MLLWNGTILDVGAAEGGRVDYVSGGTMRTLMTPRQFADIYGYTEEEVLRLIREGNLPAEKRGDAYLLDLAQIEHLAPEVLSGQKDGA